jgi:hypothetical protein
MPGANTTIDARAALRRVIKARYGRTITLAMWSTMSPGDAPPDGLGSGDVDDWQITLERASAYMATNGYTMSDISWGEAGEARGAKLNGSVALLVSKASKSPQARRSRIWRAFTVLLGIGGVLGLAKRSASRRSKRRSERR